MPIFYLRLIMIVIIRKRVNKRVIEAKKIMYKLAKHDGVIWDLFSVMGGVNSIVKWEENGLAKSDKIHFTTKDIN